MLTQAPATTAPAVPTITTPLKPDELVMMQAHLLYWDDIASAQWAAMQRCFDAVIEQLEACPRGRQPGCRQERSALCRAADTILAMMPQAAHRRAMLEIIRADSPDEVTPEMIEVARSELASVVRHAQLDGRGEEAEIMEEVFAPVTEEPALPDASPAQDAGATPPSVMFSNNPELMQELLHQAQMNGLAAGPTMTPLGWGVAIGCDSETAQQLFEAAVEILNRRNNAHNN